ncbi:GAF domain-containing protein, partial [bacterium]|nr:GAF domain-containing protein [bacterium]
MSPMAAIISTAPSSDPAEPSRDLPAEISRGGAISELGRRAVLGHDPIDLMHLAVDLLRSVLGVEYAKVLHQPVAGEPLVLIAGSGWRDSPVGEITIPCGRDSQAGYTLLCDEPVLVEDLAGDTRFSGPPFLLDHGVTSGMSVVIRGRSNPYGVLGVHSTRRRRFTPTDSVFLQSVANILGSAVETRRAVDLVEQSARYDAALAECAQALLASSGEDRIQHALEALLVATEATYVFLERNVMDPTIGFCSEFVAEAKDSGAASYKLDNELWDLAPWDQLPTTRESLENGRPITIIPRELEGPEYDLYATDPFPVKSELEVPILINGEWAGLIGFSDQVVERRWSATDVSLLTTAARMLGAFWERESDRQRLEQMNADKDAFLASVSHELRTPL